MVQNPRGNVVAQQRPDAAGPLLVIERIFAGGDFAPTGEAVGDNFHEYDVARIGAAETRLKEVLQRHADVPQIDLFDYDSHGPNK